MVPVRDMPMPKVKYPLKCPYRMTPTRIVVHNTYNDAPAENEVKYMQGNLKLGGFHAAVDDKEIIRCSPFDRNTWNATDGNGPGNRQGIAIEICYSKSGGERFIQAEKNAAEYIAKLLKERNWGLDRVTRHYDYFPEKGCPHRTMAMGWQRFLDMVKSFMNGETPQPTPAPVPSAKEIDAFYRVRTQKHGWLPEVCNLADYAGWEDSPITDVAIKVSRGSVKYRVHVMGGGWLPWVTGYNINDIVNGYAGNGKVIDAIEVYFYTPDDIRPYQKAKYRVAPVGGGYYSFQHDNETTNGQDGYAGLFGKAIGKFQLTIE